MKNITFHGTSTYTLYGFTSHSIKIYEECQKATIPEICEIAENRIWANPTIAYIDIIDMMTGEVIATANRPSILDPIEVEDEDEATLREDGDFYEEWCRSLEDEDYYEKLNAEVVEADNHPTWWEMATYLAR